jgi:hypothetical protein
MTTEQTALTFEIEVYEKAEHWVFFERFQATDEQAARADARKRYPARSYSVRSVHCIR